MCSIHYTVLAVLPPRKKKFAPSLTGDINVQSSHWNNGKMKIVYNSAYVQIETFNFTFNPQAIIVYSCLCANFQEITMPICQMPNITVQSKRVEPSRLGRAESKDSARLGVCVVCVVCCVAAKMTAGHSYLLLWPNRHVACVVLRFCT